LGRTQQKQKKRETQVESSKKRSKNESKASTWWLDRHAPKDNADKRRGGCYLTMKSIVNPAISFAPRKDAEVARSFFRQAFNSAREFFLAFNRWLRFISRA
jgi:hypothetical protein